MSDTQSNMSGNAPARDDFRVVDPETMDWINARASWIVDQFGRERIRSCPVVLPTAEFFPAPYSETEEGARAMLDQLCGYLEIDAARVSLLLAEEGERAEGIRAAIEQHALGDRIVVCVASWLLEDSARLAATMAHELCYTHLLNRLSADTHDLDPLADLLSVFLGLGVLTANAALREKDGAVSQHGYIALPVYGYALALFSEIREEVAPPWSKNLRPDVQYGFQWTLNYFSENGTPDLQSAKTTVAGPQLPWLTPADVHAYLPASNNDGLCRFCGAPLPNMAIEEVCEECRNSIEENELRIEADKRENESVAWSTWKLFPWLLLASILGALLVVALFQVTMTN